MKHPDWAKSANLYEVNVRQFSSEGTFEAFRQHLPRLKKMGVSALWLMPIQPVGIINRKGTLGSGYSCRDHLAVNPEFGTMEDFQRLVDSVHAFGMKIIIDWVANHTAWDHPWVTEHPDWYKKDAAGNICSLTYDNGKEIELWSDVVGLDFAKPAVWDAMSDALKFWVAEMDVDGYRCDVASMVPTPFWNRVRAELDAIKPVFMLAESADPALHEKAFDMTYEWGLFKVMIKIAHGEADTSDLIGHLDKVRGKLPPTAYRMTFTTNHDLNAWEGSDIELYGPSFKAFAVLAATLTGMPMIYNGQEAVLDKRLPFFEKDFIDWKSYGLADFYTGLLKLKAENPALWNGEDGAPPEVLPATTKQILAFRRSKDGNEVAVTINLSGSEGQGPEGSLAPWDYRIQVK